MLDVFTPNKDVKHAADLTSRPKKGETGRDKLGPYVD